MKKVLLLTGCVNPNGMVFTFLNNAEKRKDQYINAINWYLNNTEFDIIFVENTNTDLTPFLEIEKYQKRLEYLTFDGNNYDKKLGKGYGEAIIIQHALNHSKKIKKEDVIIKVTGRLIVLNINKLALCFKKRNSLYIKESRKHNRMWFQSNFFMAPPDFYYLIVKNLEKLNDSEGYFFEHLMYDLSSQWKEQGGVINELMPPVLFDGQSGSTGLPFHNGIFSVIKSYIKFFFHRLGIYRFG